MQHYLPARFLDCRLRVSYLRAKTVDPGGDVTGRKELLGLRLILLLAVLVVLSHVVVLRIILLVKGLPIVPVLVWAKEFIIIVAINRLDSSRLIF